VPLPVPLLPEDEEPPHAASVDTAGTATAAAPIIRNILRRDSIGAVSEARFADSTSPSVVKLSKRLLDEVG
jgi:hypothetical protein